MTLDPTQRAYFDGLLRENRTAFGRHELGQALELGERALRWAEEFGDRADVDLARCVKYTALVHMGQGDSVVRELQKILMRSDRSLVRHVAAHNISCYYGEIEDVSKSFFYAQLALEHAEKTGCDFRLAASHNRLGNLQILQSKFSEAREHYEKALEHIAEDQVPERLGLIANIGYCDVACGRFVEGFESLFTARRGYIQIKMGHNTAHCRLRLSFCFAYLEVERPHHARLHGLAGLKMAEECGNPDLVKKALYLLGEVEKLAGDDLTAFSHYARLQEEYYPDNPFLPDLLLENDTNKLVNLWA